VNSSGALFFTELLAFFSIYSLGSLAGLLSEKSGIVNIALDGKMIMGGLIFTLFFQINGFEESLD
jgi:simple sugar transport system permease protein